MNKRAEEILKYLSICSLIGTVALGSFHARARDMLLLTTDMPSLSVYIGFMTLALGAVTAILLLPYWLLSAPRRAHIRIFLLWPLAAAALMVVIQTLFALLMLTSLMDTYRGLIGPQSRQMIKDFVQGHIGWIECAIFLLLLAVTRNAADLRHRVGILGGVLAIAAVLTIAAGKIVLARGNPIPPPGTPRVILIVLDGLGADVLDAANARSGLIDRLRPDAKLTTVTATPYTSGFFGTLYKGTLDCRHPGASLLRRLQLRGIPVQWLSFHENGFPQSSDCHVSDYRGLASKALPPSLAFIPRFLGLDYNLVISAADPAAPQTADALLLPHIRTRLAAGGLLIIHVRSSPTSRAAFDQGSEPERAADLHRILRDNDYTYPARYEPMVRQERENFIAGAQKVLMNVARLIEGVRADPALSGTIFLLTADHGTVFGGGHMYYGYHTDRAVRQTPLLVFGKSANPRPGRLLSSTDIPATLADLFGVPASGFSGRSIFASDAGHAQVATLARPSPRTHRYLLTITNPDGVDSFNLFPGGKGGALHQEADAPYVGMIGDNPTVAQLHEAKEWLARFGVDRKIVNSRYR